MTMAEVVRPLDLGLFLDRYWANRSVLIRGPKRKFEKLFSVDRLFQAVERLSILARKGHRDVEKAIRAGNSVIRPEQMKSKFNSGTTICVTGIQRGDDYLAGCCAAIRAELGFLGNVHFNCYYSPEGTGFEGVHTDARIATVLQIMGSKAWRYSEEPALSWPASQAHIGNEPTDCTLWSPEDWESMAPFRRGALKPTILNAGDVLCIPAGTWHGARAVDGPSLSLNLAFDSPFLLDTVVVPLLRRAFQGNEQWRRGIPVTDPSGSQSRMPEQVNAYLQDRVSELESFIHTLGESGATREDLWNIVHAARGRATGHGCRDTGKSEVRKNDVLAVRSGVLVGPDRHAPAGTGGPMYLWGGRKKYPVPTEALSWVRQMTRESSFRAGDVLKWQHGNRQSPWRDAKALLEGFLAVGAIAPDLVIKKPRRRKSD
jgi:ribosomal protein L16 Arg81 hydroxylase